eukprot:1141913-Pelagomonas_calceolata.AAC.2
MCMMICKEGREKLQRQRTLSSYINIRKRRQIGSTKAASPLHHKAGTKGASGDVQHQKFFSIGTIEQAEQPNYLAEGLILVNLVNFGNNITMGSYLLPGSLAAQLA